jgi:hypothetical protein
MHSSPIFFFPPTFSSPVSAVTKTRASIIAWTRWGSSI